MWRKKLHFESSIFQKHINWTIWPQMTLVAAQWKIPRIGSTSTPPPPSPKLHQVPVFTPYWPVFNLKLKRRRGCVWITVYSKLYFSIFFFRMTLKWPWMLQLEGQMYSICSTGTHETKTGNIGRKMQDNFENFFLQVVTVELWNFHSHLVSCELQTRTRGP